MFLLLLSNLYESKIYSAWKSIRYSRLNIHITSGPASLLHLHLLQLIHGFSHYFSTSVVTRPPPAPGDQTWGPAPLPPSPPPRQHPPPDSATPYPDSTTPPPRDSTNPPPPSQQAGGTHPTGMRSCYILF